MIACAMCTQMALYSMQFCLWESTICQSNQDKVDAIEAEITVNNNWENL